MHAPPTTRRTLPSLLQTLPPPPTGKKISTREQLLKIGTDARNGASGLSRWVSAHGDLIEDDASQTKGASKLAWVRSRPNSSWSSKSWVEMHAAELDRARDATEGRPLGDRGDGRVLGGYSGTKEMETLPGELVVGTSFHHAEVWSASRIPDPPLAPFSNLAHP